jgi:hypothetical protein
VIVIRNIFFILIFVLNLNAQINVDTIDYSIIKRKQTYKINKITTGKANEIMKLNPYPGFTFFILDTTQVRLYKPLFLGKKIKINTNDTLLYLEFDLERGIELYGKHQWSVMHLNVKSNVMMLDKVNTFNHYVKRSFKVLKLTSSEMILKDISNLDLNRTYYLIKQ